MCKFWNELCEAALLSSFWEDKNWDKITSPFSQATKQTPRTYRNDEIIKQEWLPPQQLTSFCDSGLLICLLTYLNFHWIIIQFDTNSIVFYNFELAIHLNKEAEGLAINVKASGVM